MNAYLGGLHPPAQVALMASVPCWSHRRVPADIWPLEPWTAQALTDLRRRRGTPTAWAAFLWASWRRARATARRETALVQSWRRLCLTLLAASAFPVGLIWRRHGPAPARRVGGLLLAGLAWQQADAYVHLGLNRRLRDGVLMADLGPATWLSYIRGACAYWLLAATVSAVDLPGLAPGTLLTGILTDLLDGALARRQRRTTKLGAYADGEADVVLAAALLLAAMRRGALPAHSEWLLVPRYVAPGCAALGLAIARGRAPSLAHTLSGQLCGVAMAGLLGCALAPRRWQRLVDRPRWLLLPLTAALSVASGIAQLRRVCRVLERPV